jgi:universal stress protein family protein
MGVIVVGVDFSEGLKAAVRFGLAEAKLRHATLRAVHAWKVGYIGVPGIEGFYPIPGFDPGDVHPGGRGCPRSDPRGGRLR